MNSPSRLRILRALLMVTILLVSAYTRAHADGCVSSGVSCAPEIDPSLATSGIALIAGLALLLRGRRKR